MFLSMNFQTRIRVSLQPLYSICKDKSIDIHFILMRVIVLISCWLLSGSFKKKFQISVESESNLGLQRSCFVREKKHKCPNQTNAKVKPFATWLLAFSVTVAVNANSLVLVEFLKIISISFIRLDLVLVLRQSREIPPVSHGGGSPW